METFYAKNKDILLNCALEIDDPNEVFHAYASLRIKAGDTVEIINGRGFRFRSEVVECSKKRLFVKPLEIIENVSDYKDIKLTVAVSLLNKNSKMKLLIEKLTEIGISEFIPYISERTAFPKMKTDSLKPNMVSALKQCGGSTDVVLSKTLTFKELSGLRGFDEKYFADIGGESVPCGIKRGHILAVIGPEGGLTENEAAELSEKGFKKIKLNKRILRAETAAIVTASKFLS